MTKLTVLIIEDDLVWQLKLQMMLDQLSIGKTTFVSSIAKAQQALLTQVPDLVIADIVVADGVTLNLFTPPFEQVPVIFQTGYHNEDYLKRALVLPHVGFLLKPFERLSLQAAIQLLFSRMPKKALSSNNGISVIGKHKQRIQIPLEQIYWIKTEGNYSIINTINQKYVLKRSLRKVAEELTNDFIQVQKAYIVNCNHIERIGDSSVLINHQHIPVGRKYRKLLFDLLRVREKNTN